MFNYNSEGNKLMFKMFNYNSEGNKLITKQLLMHHNASFQPIIL